MARVGHIGAALIVAMSLFPVGASGQAKSVQKYQRDATVDVRGDQLLISLDCPEVFSDRIRQRLSSGFTSRVLIQLQLMARSSKTPFAQGLIQYTIRYDIWEERFAVRLEGLGERRFLQLRTMDELIKKVGIIDKQPLILIPGIAPGKRVRARVRVDVNPTSPEIQRKVRSYVANPDGRRAIGSPRSFFGSFSRIFVNEKNIQADAVLIYTSRMMDLPDESRPERP